VGRRDFQYSIRADQIERVDGAERRSLAELHDRELEEYLLARTADTDWQSFTPTWNNVTLGTGSTVSGQFRYTNVARTAMHVRAFVKLGTGGGLTASQVTVTLPDNRQWTGADPGSFGVAWYFNASVPTSDDGSTMLRDSPTAIELFDFSENPLDSSRVYAWTVDDEITVDIVVQVDPL